MKTALTPTRKRDSRISCRLHRKISRGPELKIKNVLVPTDFSESSFDALEFATGLTKSFGAQLHLIHVIPPNYPFAVLADLPMIAPAKEVNRRVRRHLAEVAREHHAIVRPENVHTIEGCAFEEICQLARKIDIDLIVMATRGNTGVKHIALGSTAERVVRHAPCPVLTVRNLKKANRNGKTSPRAFTLRKILVPVDFSEDSFKGLEYAKALAKKFGSTITLLHSVHFQYFVTNDEYVRYDLPLLAQDADKSAHDQMAALVAKTDWNGIRVEADLQIGHAGEQICARAKHHDVDLVVTSTHGMTGFKHVLLGSTADFVVRKAECPVLIVPSHPRPVLT